MKNIELFHKNRPIELKLKGSEDKLVLELVSFKSFRNIHIDKTQDYYFIRLKPKNLNNFNYFTNKILYFYIRKELRKYLNLFYIRENFFFELLD